MDWKEVLRRRLATPNTCPNSRETVIMRLKLHEVRGWGCLAHPSFCVYYSVLCT
ncbi:PPP2R3C isoform 19 [Pongo abelii]|uniref:PPP2R3C isoform 19 n=1 Tax=Pongo abelii TaxID=9601 RepID=A0A2J8TI91_PONAB|nr:PPP2R3C isoform 19 [Pongo abelii]